MKEKNLGKLLSVHGIAPAYLQRAAIVAIVAFVFFLAMMFAFSLRQNIGYFLLATAFLIVELFTLTGWIMQKRSELKLYENGFVYKKKNWTWDEIESVRAQKANRSSGYEIKKKTGEKIVLTDAVFAVDSVVKKVESEIIRRR